MATRSFKVRKCTGSADMDYHKERSRQISRKCAEKRAKRLHHAPAEAPITMISRVTTSDPFA